MVFTNARFKDSPSVFPAPPNWLVWIERVEYVNGQHRSDDKGMIRHVNGLFKAKKYVKDYATPYGDARFEKFTMDWSVYEWNHSKEKYVLQFSGKKGDIIGDNELMQTIVRRGDPNLREVGDAELAAALQSIQAVQQAAAEAGINLSGTA